MITEDRIFSCIVNVRSNEDESIGTAFFVSEDYLVTAAHVVAEYFNLGEKVLCRLCNPPYWFYAECIEKDDGLDLALLKFPGHLGYYCSLEIEKKMIGEQCMVYGFPEREDKVSFAKPVISAYLVDEVQLENANAITYGFSGAPLIAESGNVVGMVRQIVQSTDRRKNIAYATPSGLICNRFKNHLNVSHMRKPADMHLNPDRETANNLIVEIHKNTVNFREKMKDDYSDGSPWKIMDVMIGQLQELYYIGERNRMRDPFLSEKVDVICTKYNAFADLNNYFQKLETEESIRKWEKAFNEFVGAVIENIS